MKNQSKKLDVLYKAQWKEEIIPEKHVAKCHHYFEFQDIARCTRCGLGLMGVIDIKEGKPVL